MKPGEPCKEEGRGRVYTLQHTVQCEEREVLTLSVRWKGTLRYKQTRHEEE